MKTPLTSPGIVGAPRALGLLATAVLFAAPALMVSATPARAETITCRPIYDFCVEVDGKYPQDARFYTSPDSRGKHMIDIPSQSVTWLIDMANRKAVSIPRANVHPDGENVKLDTSGASGATYALQIEGPVLRFDTNNGKVRVLKVLDRAPVVGEVGMDALIADRPEYREGIRRYTPDAVAMDAIKAWKKPLEIEAYFATWCPHCLMYMPKLLRVLKDANNQNIKVTLVGVPKNFGLEKGPWEGKNIQGIPAIMVKYEGKEVTRLGSHEGAVPEVELAGIMNAIPK